jgi:NAD(P)-dependent dehydrogenase (short-subunit alcohol dehydrogenase family)
MLAAEAFDLTGRVAWVTGSSRGIGRVIAAHLSAHGASVVVHGRDRARLDDVVADLGGNAMAVACDVRDTEAVEGAVAEIEGRLGRLDAVIANVGGALGVPLADMEPRQWAKMLDLNVTGSYNVARAGYPLLRQAGGAVVFISATAAQNPAPGFGAYGAAKAALEHLTRSLASEWGPDVRVNCVAPGLVRTEGAMKALFGDSNEKLARAGRAMALGRVGEPEDIAWACHYLVSTAASYVTGTVLTVDGGAVEGVAQRVGRAMS